MFKKLFLCILAAVICSGVFLGIIMEEEQSIDVSVSTMPVEPTPVPPPPPDYAALEVTLTDMLENKDGDWSLFLKDYETGETISINSHQVYSASLIKLYVAAAVYNQAESGALTISASTEDLIRRMLTYSDNNAWSSLARILGGGSYTNGMNLVTTTAQHEGFADTGQFFQGSHRNYNFTSVNDCGAYMQRLLDGSLISPEYSEQILNYLKQQEHRQKIPSGVPEGIETANKTGELDYVQGDAAIIYAPKGPYILVMIGDSLGDAYGQIPFFGEVSELIYEYLEE